MKYYKLNNKVFGFDDDQLDLVTKEMRPMTDQELKDHIDPPINKWLRYQGEARSLLEATDLVALRCWKAGIAYPQEWQDYTAQLRVIVGATEVGDHTAPLPIAPEKPAGI